MTSRPWGPSVPVTVKIRSGLRDGDELGRRAAPRLVAAGAAAVCIHPRTAAQLYRGRADHAVTRALAAELPVPVIASGDVDGRAAALALLEGGAAAVMLARHALGQPVAVRRGARRRAARRLAKPARGGAAVRRRRAARHGARGVGHLRQFWQRFRRSGALDRPLAQALMRAPDAAACALCSASDEAPQRAFAQARGRWPILARLFGARSRFGAALPC